MIYEWTNWNMQSYKLHVQVHLLPREYGHSHLPLVATLFARIAFIYTHDWMSLHMIRFWP